MQEISEERLAQALRQHYWQEVQRLGEQPFLCEYTRPMGRVQVRKLAQYVLRLPIECQSLLFCHYCFDASTTDSEELLETGYALGQLRYLHRMLSGSMKLGGLLVHQASMKRACNQALDAIVAEAAVQPPKKPVGTVAVVMRRVALVAAIAAIGFGGTMVASATLRQQFRGWLVETFPQYSTFIQQETGAQNMELAALQAEYIPLGFELSETIELSSILSYQYLNAEGHKLSITYTANAIAAKNTENAEIHAMPFKDGEALWWRQDDFSYFMWNQEGVDCHITAQLDHKEVVRIAENIKIRK